MLFLTSPAKSLDWESAYPDWIKPGQPLFLDKTEKIVEIVKKWSEKKLQKKMHISDDLAKLNWERFRDFSMSHTIANSRPALWAYKGDIMREFDLGNYGKEELEYAQKSVRFISGLYGYLRPFDLMQPYRLEMKIKMGTKVIDDLAEYWSEVLTRELHAEAKNDIIVNLASVEYAKAINWKDLGSRVLNVDFKDKKNGEYLTVGIFAKKARGMMIDWCIRNKSQNREDMKHFDTAGYRYLSELSDDAHWVFGR